MPRSELGFVITLPPISIVPPLEGSRPATSIIKVLLPQPLGPMIETNSPASIDRLTEVRASTVPWRPAKVLETPRREISAGARAGPGEEAGARFIQAAPGRGGVVVPMSPAILPSASAARSQQRLCHAKTDRAT